MNKQTAIIAMLSGIKVRHALFGSDEYITFVNGNLVDESGLELNEVDFWSFRNSSFWESEWYIYGENGQNLYGIFEDDIKDPFYSVEVSPVKDNGNECYVCEEGEEDFWSVYVRKADNLAYCVANLPKHLAVGLGNVLNEVIKREKVLQ